MTGPGDLAGVPVVIWTTTPWTIPANRAVSFNPEIEYGLYECSALEEGLAFEPWIKPGDRLIVADKLAESVMKAAKAASWTRVAVLIRLASSAPIRCATPVSADTGIDVPLLAGDHVSDDTGTGFVHTAPGHGEDDYNVWVASGHKKHAIDPRHRRRVRPLHDECPGFEGLEIIRLEGKKRGEDGPANKAVMEKLIEAGNLLARGLTTVRDAHLVALQGAGHPPRDAAMVHRHGSYR